MNGDAELRHRRHAHGGEGTLCRVPDVRYAAVVPDEGTRRWVAAVVTTARRIAPAARAAVCAEHGAAAAARVVVLPVDRLPLTEQGKPDRSAIRRLAAAAAA